MNIRKITHENCDKHYYSHCIASVCKINTKCMHLLGSSFWEIQTASPEFIIFFIKHFLEIWAKYSSKIVFFHKSNIEETSSHSLDMKNRTDTPKVLKRCAQLFSMKTRVTFRKNVCTMTTNKSAMIFVFFWPRWRSIKLTIQCITFWIMFCCPTLGPQVCTLPESSHFNWNKTNNCLFNKQQKTKVTH